MDLLSLALAPMAGALSILSPCVLPLLPVVLGAAHSEHRLGAAALALGVACSFTALGLFVSTIGFAIGLDAGVFRLAAAGMMMALGVALLVPRLQTSLASAAGPLATVAGQRLHVSQGRGVAGQFGIGLLLGAVWAPCAGPTIGAASLLAARGESLGMVGLVMALFGLGAALPLLGLGLLSREVASGVRGRLANLGGHGKTALGVVLVVLGLLIVSGLDKVVEAALVEASPDWLTRLSTSL